MFLSFWKKNKSIDIFANELANELFSSIQPKEFDEYFNSSSKKDKIVKKNRKKIDVHINNIIKQIQQFRMTHSLGVYGKARLQLKLNERLEELGYDKETVRSLKEIILVKIP